MKLFSAKSMRKRMALLFSLLLLLSAFPVTALALPDAQTDLSGQIIILHTNDTHSRVNDFMGFTAAAALKKAYEKAGATVLLLDAGDTLHGKPVFNLSSGDTAVQVLNAAGYDAMAPGNHDFNYGAARLKALSAKMNFPLLTANVRENGKPFTNANTIIEKNGHKIGIFGLTTPEAAHMTNPLNVVGITFEDPVKAAKAQVAELKAQGVDYIIALCHIGLEGSYTTDKIARAVPGIDVIVDGHSHTLLEKGKPVNNTVIASTGEYLQHVGLVSIAANGKITAELVSAEQFSGTSAEVDKLVNKLVKETNSKLKAVVGSTKVTLDGERANVRTRETNLGNLVADALRSATGADVAMNNGGGLRVTIPAGKITKAQVLEVLPFGNYAVLKEISGADILKIMEMGIGSYPEASGGFPQVSGISFTFDPQKPKGRRIVNAWINEKPLEKAKIYTFATNDFLSAGGDGYTMLASAKTLGEFPTLDEIVMDFLAKNKQYIAKVEGRIVNIREAKETEEAA